MKNGQLDIGLLQKNKRLIILCSCLLMVYGLNAKIVTFKCLDRNQQIDYLILQGLSTAAVCRDSSFIFFNKAIELAEKSESYELLAIAHFHLGELYQTEISHLDKAKWHITQSIRFSDQSTCGYLLVRGYWTLGRIYTLLPEKRDSAIYLFDRAESFALTDRSSYYTWWIIMSKFNFYDSANKQQEAQAHLERALEITRTRNKRTDHGYLLIRAMEYYRSRGHNERHAELYNEYMEKFGGSHGKMDFQKINHREYLMVMENQLKMSQLSNTKRKNVIILLITCVLAILTLLSYYGWYKNKKLTNNLKIKNDEVKKALDEKCILLKEIHHRVKNNLQVVSSLLYLQKEHVKDKEVAKALLEGQNRIKTMALIHKNLYQEDNLTGIDMKVYFERLIKSLLGSYKFPQNEIELNMQVEDICLDIDTVIPLALIVNELVSNSLKHAFINRSKGKLSIMLSEKYNGLLLTVEDNGIGLPNGFVLQNSDSFGFELIQLFADKLDSQLSIRSEKGCVTDLLIKKYKRA